MPIFNSVSTPLVVLMVILLAAGAIFGTAISGADYLNPAASNAEARRINAETIHQQVLYQESERLAEAQTDAQIQALEQSVHSAEQEAELALEYQQLRNETQLSAYETLMNTINNMVWLLGIVSSIALILAVGLKLGLRIISAMRINNLGSQSPSKSKEVMPSIDPWQSREFRKRMVRQARQNEAMLRYMKINQLINNSSDMAKKQWNELPLAE